MITPESMDFEERATTGFSEESKLVRLLYPAPAERKTGKIIRWWEKRRFAYNAVLAGCGMGTAMMALLTLNPPLEILRGMVGAGLPLVIMANLCYTLGWMTEGFLNKIWGRGLRPVGPALFRAGLTLAVGIAFVVPTIMLCVAFVVRIATGNI